MKEKRNWQAIGTLVVITLCISGVMNPAMPQSSLSFFNNASNATDGEIPEATPATTPTSSPSPSPTPTQSPTPGTSPGPSPAPSPSPTPSPTPTPTPGPTPTLTPSPSPSPTPSPAAPSITSFAPSSPVYNTEGATRTFNIITDQTVNVSWLLNGTEVQLNTSVKNASYTNTSAVAGTWNVSTIASNENGTAMQTWIWTVSQQVAPTPSPSPSPYPSPTPTPIQLLDSNVTVTPSTPFYIFGWVHYENNSGRYNFSLNITNTNTGRNYHAKTSDNFFHLFLNVSEGDMLEFNVSDGERFNITNHTVSREDVKRGGLFSFNLTLESPPYSPPDFTVSSLSVDLENPIRGDVLNVSAVIGNIGGSVANSTVMFYDEKNISLYRFYWNIFNFTNSGNDTIILPGALKIRVHFADLGIQGNNSYVNIYNETGALIESFSSSYQSDFWTNWSIGSKIRIEAKASDYVYFMIDKYETIFAFEPITLGIKQSKPVSAKWNASAWLTSGEDIVSGDHTIRVEVAPALNESNTENNNMSIVVSVRPINVDLEITNISLEKAPLDADSLILTATIKNNGMEDATNFPVVFIDGFGEGNRSGVVFNETTIDILGAGNMRNINTTWNATFGYHTITVIADPDDKIPELNEANNQASTECQVNASRDFAVTNISFTINNEPVASMNLTTGRLIKINATINITNLANRGGSVDVSCYLDNTSLLDTTTVSFDANNETSHAIFEWSGDEVKNHNITVVADPDNETVELNESNNIFSQPIYVDAPDLTVTNLAIVGHAFDPEHPEHTDPACNYPNKVIATIKNEGNVSVENVSVEFYAGKDISINRFFGGWKNEASDTITQPGANKIRVHFNYISVGSNSYVSIFDKDNNTVDKIEQGESKSDYWSKWAEGDTIRIYAYSGGITSYSIIFGIDKYEYVFANETISVAANTCENASGIWMAAPATITNETESLTVMLDDYVITVIADPDNEVRELNETNNKISSVKTVVAPWDFAVTDITFIPEKPREGEVVVINASIENLGTAGMDTTIAFYVDDNQLAIKNVYADINKTNYVEANWTARPSFFYRTSEHNITVSADPEDKIDEKRIIILDGRKENIGELNNDMSKLITIIPSANLTITNLTLDPPDPIAGSPVNVTATIKNTGNGMENCTVWFYIGKNETYYSSSFSSNIIISSPWAKAIQVHIKEANTDQYHEGNWLKVYDYEGRLVETYNGSLSNNWTEWCRGNTTTIEWDDYNGITIDKYRIPLGNKTANLKPGDSVNCTIVWNATQGDHILWAEVNGNITDGRDVFVSGTDLAVTNVSVIKNLSAVNEVFDGDRVKITANITNMGRKNATNFTVKFTDNGELFNMTNITGLNAGASLPIQAIWNASLKRGNNVVSEHIIRVEIDPCNNAENENENDWNKREVHVKRSRDFSITNVSFTISNESVNPMNLTTGELITLNVTLGIINLGNSGGSVEVGCYLDNSSLLNTTRVSFDAGNGTRYARIDWKVHVVKDHTITVVADPWNKTIEFDESNNASCPIPIRVMASDLWVKKLSFYPESLEEGDMVNITATVVNNGDKNASNVTVRFADGTFTDGKIHTVDYMLESPHPLPPMYAHTWVITHRGARKMRVHFAEIHTDANTELYINGNPIGWEISKTNWTSDWVDGDRIEVRLYHHAYGFGGWGFNITKYEYMGHIEDVQIPLNSGKEENLTVKWNATPAGAHDIIVIIDPDEIIPELNESNNELRKTMIVQGADLMVSDMHLTINGTEMVNNTLIDGETVNISANISNIGIKPAKNFNVSFFIDDEQINVTPLSLIRNESIEVSTEWIATGGDHVIKVIADWENKIFETNESNNEISRDVKVRGADLLVKDITFTVIPPENDATNVSTTNATGNGIYDADTVMINATIVNQGVKVAENFTVDMFCSKRKLEDFIAPPTFSGWYSVTREWEDADGIYVHIEKCPYSVIKIYDKNDEQVYYIKPPATGWYLVRGDRVRIWGAFGGPNYANIHFYAGNITKIRNLSLDLDELTNVSIIQNVSTGNHIVRVFVDPENKVHENSEDNNVDDKPMHVFPSRDFTASLRLFYNNETGIGVNDTVWDGDQVIINATIGMGVNESDPYHEYRKGIAETEIIDEHEWVDISPRYELTQYGYAQVVTYPGADAIRVHFKELNIPPNGFVEIKDGNGTTMWSHGVTWERKEGSYVERAISTNSSWIKRETIYVYKVGRPSYYEEDVEGRIKFVIDKYQYKKTNRTAVPLNAHKTKNITLEWNISAGNHTIKVITDPKDKIGEINELNNEMNKTLHVKPCKDPAALDLTFNPPVPAMGDDVIINALITNKGNRTANFTVDLWAVKTEYHPYESPHGDDFPRQNVVWEINSTYPEADWMGVHFTRIDTITPPDTEYRYLYVDDEKGNRIEYFPNFEGEDIWVWARGNKVKLETPRGSSPVWGFSVDYHKYKIILNHTDLTLAPDETANVTGILRNVRFGNRSLNYTIYAVVDMDNVVYETNESNNEISKDLELSCADLAVSEIGCREGRITAKITNNGIEDAENVTVRFIRDVECSIGGESGLQPIDEKDADVMRVHIDYLDVGKEGYLTISNGTFEYKYKETKKHDFWSPWMSGNYIRLDWHKVKHFKMDRYEYGVDTEIGNLSAGMWREENVPEVEGPNSFTPENEVYNLTVFVDPDNEIRERNEGDNTKEEMIGPDITFRWPGIIFLNEKGNRKGYDKLLADDEYTVKVNVKNIGCLPAANFSVTLYINKSINQTIPFFPKHENVSLLKPGEQASVKFQSLKLEPGFYYVKAVVDENNIVPEINEGNNIYPQFPNRGIEVKVAPESGYKAKEGYMPMFSEGAEIHGGIIYDAEHTGMLPSGRNYDSFTTHFGDPVPANAKVICARLYVYTTWAHYLDEESHWMAFLPNATQLRVTFNGHSTSNPRIYSDIPDATAWNASYATYCYDVTRYYKHGENKNNEAIAERRNLPERYEFGINGIALLVVYGDGDAPLIRYWVAEDRDIMMAKNNRLETDTGLEYSECTRKVRFKGVTDSHLANATLKTVIVAYTTEPIYPEAHGEADALYFNNEELSIPKITEGTGHWGKVGGGIALTEGHDDARGWEYVTVRDGTNYAAIQSRGAFMGVAHAILKLTYYPDLEPEVPTRLKANAGASYNIPIKIHNWGKSKAKDFNVTISIDGNVINETISEIKGAGQEGDTVIINIPQKAPAVDVTLKVNVTVDPENRVNELINKYPRGKQHKSNGEENNIWNGTVTVTVVRKPEEPPRPSDGKDIRTPSEVVTQGDTFGGIPAGAGASKGEKAGNESVGTEEAKKTFLGYLMNNIVMLGDERAGGSLRFSLWEYLVKVSAFLIGVTFLVLGYLFERRMNNAVKRVRKERIEVKGR